MRTDDQVSMLLIEENEICSAILINQISSQFPRLEINHATNPDEALKLLEDKDHDIVVCDALLARDERIRFTWHMCSEADPVVIIITADTDLHKDSFPPDIKDVCVQHVTYKPVDLTELMQKIEDAIERVEVRKGGGET